MGDASPLAFFFSSVALFLASFPGLVRIGIAEPDFYDPRRVIQISWRPRIFLYKGFLSDEECDHIVKLVERSSCPCLFMALKFACTSAHFHVKFEQARSKMARSMVADNGSGNSVKSNVRTSSGMFLQKHQKESELYCDCFRVLHLSIKMKPGLSVQEMALQVTYKKCVVIMIVLLLVLLVCMVAVKPRKGDAVLFFSLHINGTTDPASLHGSCPVIEGEKWSAPKWIHVRSFDSPQRRTSTSGGDCSDASEFCAQWAAAGECHKNPLYMIGNNGTTGNCRRSCNVCDM
ncbi:hypothetical protein GW17_00034436 [Ensete ventricosum]|nr:hypothetical protein GW17_00034436 [Ensete ventricosum]